MLHPVHHAAGHPPLIGEDIEHASADGKISIYLYIYCYFVVSFSFYVYVYISLSICNHCSIIIRPMIPNVLNSVGNPSHLQ